MNQATNLTSVKMPFPPNYNVTAQDPSKAAQVSPYQSLNTVAPVARNVNEFFQQANQSAPTSAAMPQQQQPQHQQQASALQVVQTVRPAVPMQMQQPAPQRFSGAQTPMAQNMFTNIYSNGFVELPKTFEECKALAEYVSKSALVPAAIRNRPESVFFIIARAAVLGISWPNIFSTFFVLADKNGNVNMGMYVKAKAAMCAKFGKWEVEVNCQKGDATARGVRFDNGHSLNITYSAYEARLMGRLDLDSNGVVIGIGTWRSHWPDMMKTRALGRLLDALFPDIIGGFISKEDFDDRAYSEMLEAEQKQDDPAAAQDAAAQISRIRKGRSKAKAKEEAPAEVKPQASVSHSLDELLSDSQQSPVIPNPLG